jgi:hypothetical protein
MIVMYIDKLLSTPWVGNWWTADTLDTLDPVNFYFHTPNILILI